MFAKTLFHSFTLKTEIQNYEESEIKDNEQQIEYTITVPDTQDVPNQVEENVNSSVRDHFFSPWPRCNKSQLKEELIIYPKFLNWYGVSLTASQLKSKDLKFTPTPKRNLPEMKKGIKDFARKLSLVEFFSGNPELITPYSSLPKNKPNFCAPQNQNKNLESVIKFLQKHQEKVKNKSNISKHKWKDILNLKKNKEIIIKEAVKGWATVKHYLKIISDHLNDETTYKMVESNCDARVMKGIAKIIGKCKDNFTNKENEYLISFPYNTSKLCDLP